METTRNTNFHLKLHNAPYHVQEENLIASDSERNSFKIRMIYFKERKRKVNWKIPLKIFQLEFFLVAEGTEILSTVQTV